MTRRRRYRIHLLRARRMQRVLSLHTRVLLRIVSFPVEKKEKGYRTMWNVILRMKRNFLLTCTDKRLLRSRIVRAICRDKTLEEIADIFDVCNRCGRSAPVSPKWLSRISYFFCTFLSLDNKCFGSSLKRRSFRLEDPILRAKCTLFTRNGGYLSRNARGYY